MTSVRPPRRDRACRSRRCDRRARSGASCGARRTTPTRVGVALRGERRDHEQRSRRARRAGGDRQPPRRDRRVPAGGAPRRSRSGAKANGTQPTHAKCCGVDALERLGKQSPTLKQRNDHQGPRVERSRDRACRICRATTSRNTTTASNAKNQRKSCCATDARGIGHGQHLECTGPLQEAVEARPTGRDRQAAPAAQVEDRVEDHPVDDVAGTRGEHVDQHRRDPERGADQHPFDAPPIEAAEHRDRGEPDRERRGRDGTAARGRRSTPARSAQPRAGGPSGRPGARAVPRRARTARGRPRRSTRAR